MPLNKQIIPVSFATNPDQKTDPKQLQPGTPTSITNARFVKGGRIDKRTGHSKLPMTDLDGTTLTNFKGMIGSQDHLVSWVGDSLYSWNKEENAWSYESPYFSCDTTSDPISSHGEGPQGLLVGDLIYYVYSRPSVDNSPGTDKTEVCLSVATKNTKAIIAGPIVLATEGMWPKIVEFNSKIFCIYQNFTTSIFAVEIDPTQPQYTGSTSTLANADWDYFGSTRHHYGIYVWKDTRLILAYQDSSTPTTLNIRYFDDTMTELTGSYALRQIASFSTSSFFKGVTIVPSSSDDRFFVLGIKFSWANAHYAIINEDGSLNTGATAYTLTSPTNVQTQWVRAYGEPFNDGSNDGIKFWVSANNTSDNVCETQAFTITNGGTQADLNEPLLGMYLIAQPFTYDGNRYFVCASYLPDQSLNLVTYLDDGYFTVSSSFYGRARIGGIYEGNGQRSGGNNATIINSSTGVYEISLSVQDTLSARFRVISVSFDFTSNELFSGIQFGRSLIISGSNPHIFDGNTFHELCYFQIPKAVELAQGINGFIEDGVYSVVMVFEFTTKDGFIIRSAPSEATQITISGSNGNASIDVTFKYLNQSNLLRSDDNINKMRLFFYMTESNGSLFYKIVSGTFGNFIANSIQYGIENDYTSEEGTINVVIVPVGQQILYTDSGELPTTPIPPLRYLTKWNNRIFGAGEPENSLLYYTKINQRFLVPEFSEAFTVSTQEFDDDVKGIKGFADKLIVMTRQSIYYTFGEGPDNLGGGGDFAQLEKLLGVTGTVNNASIAVNKQGLWYESERGVYLLSQSLQAEYAGAMFEDDLDGSIVNSVVKIDDEVAVFATGTQLLEFDYYFGIWSKTTGITPTAVQIYDGELYILDGSDQVWKKDNTVWKDDTTSYGMSIESGWISTAGVTGFQRLYRIFLVCEYKSVHTLNVQIAYDYGFYTDESTFDPVDAIDNDVYRFFIHVSQQKCQAFRIKITEVITDGTSGTHESLQINFIGMQVGVKRGLPKIKDAQKIGVSRII